MTWQDFMTARQALTDEFVGVLERQKQRADLAKVEQTKAAIRQAEAMNGAG
jgi:hypothetical protein